MNDFVEYWDQLLSSGSDNYQLAIEKEVERLRQSSAARDDVRGKLGEFLREVDFVPALARLNVPSEVNFLSEFSHRLISRFLPEVHEDNDFIAIALRLNKKHRRFLKEFDSCSEAFQYYLDLISPLSQESVESVKKQFLYASELITLRIASKGTHPKIKERLQEAPELRDSFLELQRQVSALIANPEKDCSQVLELSDLCVEAARYARGKSRLAGISVSLSYKLLSIESSALRVKRLIDLCGRMHVDNSAEKILRLLTEVSSDETEITKLSSLFDNSASLLIHQISEHNSEYGEKYTGGSKEDYKWIWKAGAVGGLIVGFLGILKPLLASLMLPPLVEATAYGFMYSFIFLAIYFLGGVLATKQPAMTAARLASAIDGEGDSEEALLKLSELFTNIFRIQITATLANAIFAFPAAYLVAFVFSKISLVDSQLLQADYLVESLHPLASNTLFYAFLTGIALAVSGLFGGLMMNWFNFENIEQRLKHYYAPGSFWNRKAESIGKRMSGVSSNVCLGMLLGLFSELGYLLGLPFDVRHITFASSQIGTSLGSGYQPDDPNVWIWLLISVALIGAINLVVSFFVTIWTIFKSRKIEIRMLSTLFKYIGKRFLRNPFTFFLPIGLRKRSETLSECTW